MTAHDSNLNGIRLHPVSLAFTKDQIPLEKLYLDYYFTKNLKHLRFSHYISILFYLTAAIIDYAIFPSLVYFLWSIRFCVVVPCFLIGLVYTYKPGYQLFWRQLSFAYILITGISFLAMMVIAPAPDSYTYYIGVAICMMFGYTFIREPFIWSSAAGCILLALYIITAVIISMPYPQLLLYGFYLSVINCLGMIIARAFEIQYRSDFFQSHQLELEKLKVIRLAAGLEKEVRSRTKDLLHTNKELKHEIRERESIENALRVSEQNYRSLQANIPIGLYRIMDGEVRSANPAMIKIFKAANPKSLLLRPVANYFHAPGDFDGVVKELREKGVLVNSQIRFKKLTGEPFWGVVNVVRAYSEDQSVFCYDGTIEDITSQKAMAEEKEKLTLQLRQAHKMESLGTLAGGIAHDFNNILTSAIGYTELSLDDVQKGSLVEMNLKEVRNAGYRAKALVQQILTFARQNDDALSPVQVGSIAEETLRFLRSSIPVTIEINSNISSSAQVLGNATQLHQIFMNLCTNAAHAMKDTGGVLEVIIRDSNHVASCDAAEQPSQPDRFIEISVSDTGHGIPPHLLGSIFDPYFTTKSLGEGTGMGLAVVHGIVESYGGKIRVKSNEHQGTEFSIHLPVTGNQSVESTMNFQEDPKGTEHLLIIDDEDVIAELMGQLLGRLGYHVTIFTSSPRALEHFRETPDRYDLVITDMTMPEMTGNELAAELLEIRDDLPIILCSGYTNQITAKKVKSMGAKDFLVKPISRQILAKVVRKVLDEVDPVGV